MYKVFLVEDEIVIREGIRDNVDWKSAGFEFCGEAADGEIALPLIETTQPDVVITDIKMPFMDGLQLSKIIREHMPWIKVIILSGHDEFEYAQAAVKLGVTEYLLKPVSALDLRSVLVRVATTLEKEKKEREDLRRLRGQVEDNLAVLRDKFLLRLVMGGISSAEAVEQSGQLGLEIIAKCYLIILLRIELCESAQPFNYQEYQRVERLVASLVETNPDALLTRKDMEELVIVLKGENPEQLKVDGDFIAGLLQREVETKTTCGLLLGVGNPQQRIGDIHRSFTEALIRIKSSERQELVADPRQGADPVALSKVDRSALEHYLKSGMGQDFDHFFDVYLQPVGASVLRAQLVKHYIFMDILLTVAQFVSDLGGDVDQVIPELHHVEQLLVNVTTIDQLKEEMRKIFSSALAFRNSLVGNQRALTIQKAKAYLDSHFTDPDLQLNDVAAQVSLSPSHFSVVFSHETGETFKDYLTRLRIKRAQELLRTTDLKGVEIAYQSGYNDPHYFSMIFKKNTGLTPREFRAQAESRKGTG